MGMLKCKGFRLYKKYILSILKKEGYVFQRNQHGHRLFTDKDIQTLKKYMELSKYDGMKLESDAKMIGSAKQDHEVITGFNHDLMTKRAKL